jgi:tRNA modification GTPase
VGIVRVSGRDVRRWRGAHRARRWRRAWPPTGVQGRRRQPIDHGLALHFPAPHSYTGEDVLELQAHGGPVVLQCCWQRCLQAAAETTRRPAPPRLPRLRLARPGEFTERAFLNGKLDLAQAEAVMPT